MVVIVYLVLRRSLVLNVQVIYSSCKSFPYELDFVDYHYYFVDFYQHIVYFDSETVPN